MTSTSPKLKIGFVGLGIMGAPMAGHLIKAGHQLFVYTLGKLPKEIAESSATQCLNGRGVAERADIIFTMVPDTPDVETALFSEDGIASGLTKGKTVVDMSSISPIATKTFAERIKALGCDYLDAPVSGGEVGAKNGTLSIMAGGDDATIDRAEPILKAMGKSVFRTGPLGSGHAAKALNNYVSAAGLAAAVEAVAIGGRFGIDPNTLVDVFNASTGRNNSTENKIKQFVIPESFTSGFSLALMAKDIRTADDLAHQIGVIAPLADEVASLWDGALKALGTTADHTEIGRYLTTKR